VIRFLLCTCVLLALLRSPVYGQTVAGRLTTPAGEPVPAALFTLLNESGEALRSTVSDSSGHFSIDAAGPGRHSLRAERIGHATLTTAAFELEPATTLTLTLAVNSPLLGLHEVRAAEADCVPGAAAGPVAALWEQAARALRIRTVVEEAGLLEVRGVRYVRMLDNAYRVRQGILNEDPFTGPFMPFPAFVAGAGHSFVAPDSTGALQYQVPSPAVLLSQAFLASHCIDRVLADKATPDRVGLRFRPVRDQQAVGIEGVLWLDRETGDITVLEYEYRGPRELVPRGARGLVDFARGPDGVPRVSRWWLRVPRVFETSHTVDGRSERNTTLVESGALAFGRDEKPFEDPDALFPLMTGVIALDELVVEARREEFEAYLDAQPWRAFQGPLSVIKPAEIITAPPTNAFDMVRALRQRWLVPDAGPRPCYPAVYLDNMRLDARGAAPRAAGIASGSPLEEVLGQIPGPMVGAIEYIRPQEASMVYGAINTGACGVIVVHSRRW